MTPPAGPEEVREPDFEAARDRAIGNIQFYGDPKNCPLTANEMRCLNDARAYVALHVRVEEALCPISDKASCERCGRRDGMDAVVPNVFWTKISAAANEATRLCLWCMDEIAQEISIECDAAIHFSGRAIHGSSNIRFAECVEIATRSAIQQRDEALSRLAKLEQERGREP